MKLFKQYGGLRRELYILFIGRIMTNLGSMIWPMFTLILSQKLNISTANIALYMMIFSFVSMPVTLLGGKLADKLNKKNIIVVCDLISIGAYIYCSIVPITLTSIIVFAFASLFQSVEWPSYDALVADFTTSEDRERAYSLSYLGSNLGLVLAPTLGGLLFKNHLNLAFLINGLAILSSTILIFFLIKNVKREVDNSKASKYEKDLQGTSAFKFIIKNRVILLYIIMSCFGSFVYSMYNYLLPIELGNTHGDNGSVLFGTLSSVNCITVVVFTAVITRIFKKRRDIQKMLIGESLILSGYILFVSFLKLPFILYVGMVIFTLGEIFNTIGTSPFVSRRIPASHRGRIISILNISAGLVQAGLNWVVGSVYDNKGSIAAWTVVFGGGLIVLTSICIMMIFDKKDYSDLYIASEVKAE